MPIYEPGVLVARNVAAGAMHVTVRSPVLQFRRVLGGLAVSTAKALGAVLRSEPALDASGLSVAHALDPLARPKLVASSSPGSICSQRIRQAVRRVGERILPPCPCLSVEARP